MTDQNTISPWARKFTQRRRLAAVPVAQLARVTGINRSRLLSVLNGLHDEEVRVLEAALTEISSELVRS